MTRECLIFGGMRDICLTDSFGNENLILQIREELKEKMPHWQSSKCKMRYMETLTFKEPVNYKF